MENPEQARGVHGEGWAGGDFYAGLDWVGEREMMGVPLGEEWVPVEFGCWVAGGSVMDSV